MAGPASGSLTITTNASNGPVFTVALTGEGLAPLECPPDEACKQLTFDPDTGTCVIEIRTGACDDGSVCTTQDHCDQGSCVGEAVQCPTEGECGRGVCDAQLGCLAIPDADLCDDGQPCTVESCDADLGCTHLTLADGAPCGHFDTCHVGTCSAGSCIVSTLPDGAACDDGLLCTADDQCRSGACGGVRGETTPVPAAVSSAFGFGEAFMMPDIEGAPDDVAFLFTESHLVRAQGGALALVDTAPGPPSAADSVQVVATSFGAVGAAFGSPLHVTTYGVSGATFTPLGGLDLASELNGVLLAAAGDRAFAAGADITAIDITNPAAPHVTDAVPEAGVGLALLAVGDRLFYGRLDGFTIFDTSAGTLDVLSDDSGGAAIGLALSDAGVLALRSDTPNRVVADRVDVLDPVTGAVTSTLDVAGRNVAAVASHGTRAALMGDNVELVALPSGTVLASAPLFPDYVHGQPAMSSTLLLANIDGLPGARAFDVSGDALVPLTAPGYGALGRLTRAAPGLVLAASALSARLIDATDPAGPAFIGGGNLPFRASLFRLAGGDLVTAPPGLGDASGSFGPLTIVDLTDVDAPVLESARSLAAALDGRFLFAAGGIVVSISARQPGFACDIDCSIPGGRVVAEAFDVSTSPPFPYPRLGGATLAVDGVIAFSDLTTAFDPATRRIAAELVADSDTIIVVDAGDPTAPRIYPPLAEPGSFVGSRLALHGDRLYILTAAGVVVEDIGADLTELADASWASLGLPTDIAFPLAVDDETLVVGFDGHIGFLSVATLPPRLIGDVAVPIAPVRATADGDRLVVSDLAQIMTLTPACPPP